MSNFFTRPSPVKYNPGIRGFIRANRHRSGSVLLMSHRHEDDVFLIYWVKQLHHNAKPYDLHAVSNVVSGYRQFADSLYENLYFNGPPPYAIRDSQRAKVYLWEDECIYPGFPELTWVGCQRFLRRVWNDVGNGQSLILTNQRRCHYAISLKGTIHLPRNDTDFFCRAPIILHEIAHELTPGQQHNAKFVGTYMALCARFIGKPESYLRASMVPYGIDFSEQIFNLLRRV